VVDGNAIRAGIIIIIIRIRIIITAILGTAAKLRRALQLSDLRRIDSSWTVYIICQFHFMYTGLPIAASQ